jgi:hypothetical protein
LLLRLDRNILLAVRSIIGHQTTILERRGISREAGVLGGGCGLFAEFVDVVSFLVRVEIGPCGKAK